MSSCNNKQHLPELTDNGFKVKSLPWIVMQTIIELPFYVFLWIVQILCGSHVVRKSYHICIEFMIYTLQRILQDPIIQDHIAITISYGINQFIQQPNLDQLLLHMFTCMSKSQPDIARQQGQDFPIVISSFVQGIFQKHGSNNAAKQQQQQQRTTTSSPQKVHPKHNSNSQAEEATLPIKASPGTSSLTDIDPIKADIETTTSIRKVDTDELLPAVTESTIVTSEKDEAFKNHLVITRSSSSSHLPSEEQESDTLSSSPGLSAQAADDHHNNNTFLQIDHLGSDSDGATAISSSSLSMLVPATDDRLSPAVHHIVVPQQIDESDTHVVDMPIIGSSHNHEVSTQPPKNLHGPVSLLHFPFFGGRPR